MQKSQQYWDRSQHPPTQWNLRGADEAVLNTELRKKILLFFYLCRDRGRSANKAGGREWRKETNHKIAKQKSGVLPLLLFYRQLDTEFSDFIEFSLLYYRRAAQQPPPAYIGDFGKLAYNFIK